MVYMVARRSDADSLDLDRESLSSAHLFSIRSSKHIIHIRDTLPRGSRNDITEGVRPADHQLIIPAIDVWPAIVMPHMGDILFFLFTFLPPLWSSG
jgi:hypothetical protein